MPDIDHLGAAGIRSLSPYNPGKPLDELEREYGIRDAVKLASNENPLGPSPMAIEAMRAQASELHRYPDGSGFHLKAALAEQHQVDQNQICLGNGSNDILDMIARVFVEPGQTGIISQHAFIVYYLSLVYVHANIETVPADNFGHDLEQMAQAACADPAVRLMYIANPNNPTGTCANQVELRQALESIPPHVTVAVDEAYAEYVADENYPNCVDWLNDFPNLIVTRTFSKIYALAGLRIGYSISSPQIADLLNRVRQPFNCNSMALAAAVASLADASHRARSRELNAEQMACVCHAFAELGLETIESAGNFVCVDLHRPASQGYEKLLRLGVITRPVASYGLPNHLRISIGTPQENERLIDAFKILREQDII